MAIVELVVLVIHRYPHRSLLSHWTCVIFNALVAIFTLIALMVRVVTASRLLSLVLTHCTRQSRRRLLPSPLGPRCLGTATVAGS